MSKNIGRIVGRASREEPMKEECIHPTCGKVRKWGYKPVITMFYFCPICGVKL